MVIQGEKIYLRSITDDVEDTSHIIKWRNSENVRPFFIYQEPFTVENHEKWLNEVIFKKNGYQFMVYDKSNDEMIGSTYFRDVDLVSSKAEFGFFIGEEEYKGRGIGTEILKLMTEFGFNQLHFNKIYARVFSDNKAYVNCFLKNGFVKEAYLRQEVFLRGQYRDIIFLAKFR